MSPYDGYCEPCPVCDKEYADECGHHLIGYDETFPFADGDWSCPLSTFGSEIIGSWLSELDTAARELLAKLLSGAPADEAYDVVEHDLSRLDLPKRVTDVVQKYVDEAAFDAPEWIFDAYTRMAALMSYIQDILWDCKDYYAGSTHGEDNQFMSSSSYAHHWATDTAACAKVVAAAIETDCKVLKRHTESSQPARRGSRPSDPTGEGAAA